MKVLIGGAWPYANGSLHIGHISGLIAGDVIARYHRLVGNEVCYVSGSDCHGTPITIRAKSENESPEEISERYHKEFEESFRYLNFSYDYYGKTSSIGHKEFVRDFHKQLYESEYIYEKEGLQAFCETCNKFLPDRLLIGECPNCGNDTKGDQCEVCGNIFESIEIIRPHCSQCGEAPIFTPTRHLYIAISKLEKQLIELLNNRKNWKPNAISFTQRYITEGLRDRAVTRDLDWGIDVPKEGYDHKKIYIWAENVLGYLSTCYLYCKDNNLSFDSFWKDKTTKHYYVHGKDNIPFHTIILPALLLTVNEDYNLPNYIVSSEYLTLEGRKISTSKNWAIWVKDLIGKYNSDSIRYYLLTNNPDKRDSDFSWREFINCNNGELLGAYGNFVNRNLAFIDKSFAGIIPDGTLDESIKKQLDELFEESGKLIAEGEIKESIRRIFAFIRNSNKYFDDQKPWITIKTDKNKCDNALYTCVCIIANLAILLEPFLPESSNRIINWFNLNREWKLQQVLHRYKIPLLEILFERLDKKIIEEEVNKLNR